jgi:hypothetical protein
MRADEFLPDDKDEGRFKGTSVRKGSVGARPRPCGPNRHSVEQTGRENLVGVTGFEPATPTSRT